MIRFGNNQFRIPLRLCLILSTLAVTSALAVRTAAGQNGNGPFLAGEGCLLYRSPVGGRYDSVPLIHTDATLDVRGLVAAVTVTQKYENSSPSPIEAIYVFPLPHDAAVYDMEIRIGNRVIRSEIREREEAKRVYEAAKAQGNRAALVEEERPNIFTTSVANIMPGDHIDVRLCYVEPLHWEDGRMRLVFPMVVGPRYIPGSQAVGHVGTGWALDTDVVPDASRITPVVRSPETRSGHDISLAVDLDRGFWAASVQSVSHQISVNRLADGRQRVELTAGATIPNRDFVLEMRQAENSMPATALFFSPDRDSGDVHFLLAAFPPTVAPSAPMPVEMLYMIDVSGSMEGTSIQQARGALLQALDRLRPSDCFDILAFSSGYREMSPQPLPADARNVAAARGYVEGLGAGGGTEMLPALRHLMQKPDTPGYLRRIVLLTDGDLGNEEEILAALRSELGDARLYTVAIGSAPNLFLATKMAQFGRGTFTHIADSDDIQEQMTRLLATIESPVLTDIMLNIEGVEVAEVYPKRLPDLFLHQPLLVFGRISKGRMGLLHLAARDGKAPYNVTIPFDASEATFHPGITTLWARQKVEDLMDDWRQAGGDEKEEIRAGAISHAIRYRLVTRFTSLVAVESVVANPGGQSNTVPVPTELPAGWQMDSVFGAPATGTTDAFFETLGITLLCVGIVAIFALRRMGTGAIS